MEHKRQLLESFRVSGSDGASYKVQAFDCLVRDETLLNNGPEVWEPTGRTECRLTDGRLVEVPRGGPMRIAGTDIELRPDSGTTH